MRPIVVKVGGSTLGAHDTALEDIAALWAQGRRLVVVHGGGSAATEWLKVHGIASEFVDGLRVTGPDAIEVVAAVFAGLVNKQLVAQLLALGAKAVGVSGVDGAMLPTSRIDERLGFVGSVSGVDTSLLTALMESRFLPVVAPLAFWAERPAQLMNLNADTVAGELAAAVGAAALIFLTDVPGVRDETGAWAERLDPGAARRIIASGAAAGGMLPKLEACLRAAEAGVPSWIVDGREAHALKQCLEGQRRGTSIEPSGAPSGAGQV
ncbi:MAG TPA: acetylglutamate kinase [Dehalococcoidia bacterium]|nr:acetylglutamate kinase [Dehalococcoidia bacterium]